MVETSRRGWTGVERALSRSLGTPPLRLSSNLSFEWVKLLTLSFIIHLNLVCLRRMANLGRFAELSIKGGCLVVGVVCLGSLWLKLQGARVGLVLN